MRDPRRPRGFPFRAMRRRPAAAAELRARGDPMGGGGGRRLAALGRALALAVREQCAGCGFLREKTHRSDTTRDVSSVHTSHLSHPSARRPLLPAVPASCDCRAIIGHRMPHAHAPCPWHGRLVRCRCAIAGHCCSHTARKWPGPRALRSACGRAGARRRIPTSPLALLAYPLRDPLLSLSHCH